MYDIDLESPYAFPPTINRYAFSVEVKKAFLEWAQKCFEEDEVLTLEKLNDEPTIYLIPAVVNEQYKWLKENYADIFGLQLASWCTDESLWPKDRSYKAFRKFFSVKFCSMLIDMADDELLEEE